MKRSIWLLACLPLLPGCAAHYRCKVIPDGGCYNMSQVYQSTGDGFVDTRESGPTGDKKHRVVAVAHNAINAVVSGEPVLTQAQGMRVWVAPWEDKDGNLNFSYVYIRTKDAQWAILNKK